MKIANGKGLGDSSDYCPDINNGSGTGWGDYLCRVFTLLGEGKIEPTDTWIGYTNALETEDGSYCSFTTLPPFTIFELLADDIHS